MRSVSTITYEPQLSSQALKLLEYLLFSDIETIEPEITITGITYPLLTSINIEKAALDELTKYGVLKALVVDRSIACPNCGSTNIRLHLKCPKCGSFNLENKQVIQHKVCGFTDVGSAFKIIKTEKEIMYACPKCKLLFSKNAPDYSEIGRLYECQNCLYRTNNPNISLTCNVCDANFSIMDAQYNPVFAYSVDKEKLNNDIMKNLVIENIVKELAKKININVIENYEALGSSGISQKFKLLLEKNSIKVAITFLLTPDESDAINFLVKTVDVNLKCIVLSTRKVSDYLKGLSRVYNAQIVEGSNKEEITEKLEEVLKNIFEIKRSS